MSTRIFAAGDPYGVSFTVRATTLALTDADSAPLATLYRNGAPDGTVALSITRADTGVYSVSGAIPATYAAGDRVSVLAKWTIGGVAAGDFVDHVRLVAPQAQPPTPAQVAAAILATPANLLTTDSSGRVTVGSNADKTGYSLTQAFPANFASLVVSASGLVAIDQSKALTARNQDAVTAPTIGDAFQGAWTQAFGKEAVSGTAYTPQLPDNSGPARSFTLTVAPGDQARN